MKRLSWILWALLILSLGSPPPASAYGGSLSQPKEARVNLSNCPLNDFDVESRKTLFRYLAGSPR